MRKMEDYDNIVSDNSCDEEAYYSDRIDSDIEAELYGLIHHDAQENSTSLQDKSDYVEIRSGSSENNYALLESGLDKIVNDTVSPLINSIPSKDTANSPNKQKKSVTKNNQKQNSLLKTSEENFSSDAIVNNNNLYYSFESPVQKQKNQSNQVPIRNAVRNIINNPPKRKSEVVSNILENIQSKNMKSVHHENRLSKQKKNNIDHNCVIADDNSFLEVIDDSSDSDSDNSIMVLEPDNSNFQTNLSKETVVLSSDAEDSDSSMEKSFSQACQRKQTAIAKLNLNSNNKDPWQINSEDRFRTKKQSNRYHENAVVTCSKCHLKGHSAKFCSVPKAMKCFFCGNLHSGSNCNNKICTKCFLQGHDRRRCFIRHINNCDLCRMRGHSERNCPDLWRRYHLTTTKGAIVKGNPNPHSPLYCYTCGSKGHYGAECMEMRTDRWSFPTWTSVVSYKNPVAVLRGREEDRNFQERSNFDRTPLFHRRKEKGTFTKPFIHRRSGNETSPTVTPTHKQGKKQRWRKKTPKTPPNANQQPEVRPNNSVQNEVYFPRTPKISPTLNIRPLSKAKLKKLKKQNKEGYISRQQVMHRIGLHQRLGLPFPSTV